MKIISWNLLRRVGASVDDVVALVRAEKPDLLLMQEVTAPFEGLEKRLGGSFAWEPQPGRIHGLAMWSARPWDAAPSINPLRPGAWFRRICQIVTVGEVGIANVHLSHGQRLNRRQLREVALLLPPRAAVLGDFNLVGPTLLRGFRDVGPRWPTHRMGEVVPLRIDRCLARGLTCQQARVLPRHRSDHRPICVELATDAAHAEPVRYKGAAVADRHPVAAPEWAAHPDRPPAGGFPPASP